MKETLTLATQGHRFVTADERSYVGRAVVGITSGSGVELVSRRRDVPPDPDRVTTYTSIEIGSIAAKRLVDFYSTTHCEGLDDGYNCFSLTSWVTDGRMVRDPKWYYTYGHSKPSNDLPPNQAFAILDSYNRPIHSLLSISTLKHLGVWGIGAPLVLGATPEAMRFYSGTRIMELARRDGSLLSASD